VCVECLIGKQKKVRVLFRTGALGCTKLACLTVRYKTERGALDKSQKRRVFPWGFLF